MPASGSLTLPSTTSPPLHHVCQAVRNCQPTQQVPSHGMKEEAAPETLWLGVSEGCSRYKRKERNTNPACALRVCVYSSQTRLVFPPTCHQAITISTETNSLPGCTRALLLNPPATEAEQPPTTNLPATTSHSHLQKACFLGVGKQPFLGFFKMCLTLCKQFWSSMQMKQVYWRVFSAQALGSFANQFLSFHTFQLF